MKKYVMLWNGGLFDNNGKNMFNEKEIKSIFKDDLNVVDLIMLDENDEEEKMNIDDGFDMMVEMGYVGEKVKLKNDELVEMGDDFVEVSIIEIFNV